MQTLVLTFSACPMSHAPQEDVLMKAEEMLALVGGDVALSRDNSGASVFNGMSFGSLGGSFGGLFSDDASQAELQRAMCAISEEMGKTPPPPRQLPVTGASPLMRAGGVSAYAQQSALGWQGRASDSPRVSSASAELVEAAGGGASGPAQFARCGGGSARCGSMALPSGLNPAAVAAAAPRQTSFRVELSP